MRLDETVLRILEKTIDETSNCLCPGIRKSWNHDIYALFSFIPLLIGYFILLSKTGPSNFELSKCCDQEVFVMLDKAKLGHKMLGKQLISRWKSKIKTWGIIESNPTIVFQFQSSVFILSLVMSKISTLNAWFARSFIKVHMFPNPTNLVRKELMKENCFV